MNQKLAQRILTTAGLEVDWAADGIEACAMEIKDEYDLILMDCQMPEMDSYEATRQIRASGGSRASVPIIALTANAMTNDRKRCLDAGMNAYINRPLKRASFLDVLRHWLVEERHSA